MAFSDDVYIVSPEPDHVGNGHAVAKMFFFLTRHDMKNKTNWL